MSHLEELLLDLAGTAPMPTNPTPGFVPATVLRGERVFDGFIPETECQQRLVDTARRLMSRGFTAEEHREFRLALYDAYVEHGFSPGELSRAFSDVAGARN